MLKKIEHCGIKFAGVKHPDTLGEHTCRAAQISYCIALEENVNPEHAAALCIMHDIGEIRIGDAHRIAQRYLKTLDAEKRAVREQTKNLPPKLAQHIRNLWDEFHAQKTPASRVARDADLLETILQAKEYLETGYSAAKRWIENGSKYLYTKTAKKLCRELISTSFTAWWDDLNR